MTTAKLLLAGRFVESDSAHSVRAIHSPFDQRRVGETVEATEADVELATATAVAAATDCRKTPAYRRAELCRLIADGILARAEEIAQLITAEGGKPIAFSRAEVSRAVSTFRIASEEATRIGGDVIPLDLSPAGATFSGLSFRVPAGPVLGIAPFNFPLNLVAHKVAPALAAGCPIVLKPAPQTPLTAAVLGEVFLQAAEAAGTDSRQFQILSMSVPLADRLVRDDRYALVTFTGSAAVGWSIKAHCGRKKCVLELGGNAPTIVHSDADLDHAVARCVLGSYASAGQVCIKAQRLLVQSSIYDDFNARFVDAARRLGVGNPADPNVVIGPVIDARSADRIEQWTQEALDLGAQPLLSGSRAGNVLGPTYLANAPKAARVVSEEVFGPVTVVHPYENFSEAIAEANKSVYGLQAGVFTRDIGRVFEAARELEFGGVIINEVPMFRVDNFPYGGVKDSGFGREGVRYAMEDMTELRMVAVNSAGA